MKIINTNNAPAPVGPYSQAIQANGTLYISGQVGIDPRSGKMQSDFTAQANQIFSNLKSILTAAGYTIEDIVKLNIFVVDLDNFSTLNAIMQTELGNHKPARSTVQVPVLPVKALVEIDAIAYKE